MFDSEVLLPDLWDILSAVPLTLAMALAIFALSTIIGSDLAKERFSEIVSGKSPFIYQLNLTVV